MRRLGITCSIILAPLGLTLAAAGSGCQRDLTADAPPSALDEHYFRCKVQPVLTKSCAAFACHGNGVRYFKLFARNRLRLGGDEAHRNSPLKPAERAWNLDAARAMVDPSSPDTSWLLRKALEASEGGYYHAGATIFGKGNVFPNRKDADFIVLEKWIDGEKEDPACIEPGSDL
jgi:hypothetical protein